MTIQISQDQGRALKAIEAWLKTKKQVFRLFGHAGTGKTTIAKYVADMVESYQFAAYTGKAALVLQTKGCDPASTLHRVLYKSHQDEATGKWYFSLNSDSPLKNIDLLILDEVSMVDEKLGMDVLRLAKKVLVLGDPNQLPPITGAGFFTDTKPDYMLTEIHRQAADNPIIHLANKARAGEPIARGEYGDSIVFSTRNMTDEVVNGADIIITGLNATRNEYNNRVRAMRGYRTVHPQKGETLICLKNQHDLGYLNGSFWEVTDSFLDGNIVQAAVLPLDTVNTGKSLINTPIEFFTGDDAKLDWKIKKSINEFCYGYAITCHKSQGSQFAVPLILNQSAAFKEHRNRWLYTAITRASEAVFIGV